jgi:hypothetical protein
MAEYIVAAMKKLEANTKMTIKEANQEDAEFLLELYS